MRSRRAADHPARARGRACVAAIAAALAVAGCGADDEPRAEAVERAPAQAAVFELAPPQAAVVDRPPAQEPFSIALVWGLERPDLAARRLRRHPAVAAATVLGRGVALMRSSRAAGGVLVERVRPGYAIPLDAIAVDPRGYAATVAPEAREPFARLRSGATVLSQTGAALRRVGPGGVLSLAGGRRLRVIAVVDDAVLRDAEIAVAAGDQRVPPLRTSVVAALSAPLTPRQLIRATEPGAAARVLSGGPVPAAGPVGPARPAQLKLRFGEPAVGLPYGSDWIRLDPAFVRRNIVTRRVPILGAVSCHRAMVPRLRAALAELSRRGLARTVDRGDYGGCYAPRRIQPRGQLSLHAWGLAVDLNAAANPFRGRSRQHPRLVRIMERHGFTWGGRWPTRPDPMHFELR